jgi:hypothetical protein
MPASLLRHVSFVSAGRVLAEGLWPLCLDRRREHAIKKYMNVLVVGGAGYIGSHCVRQLQAAGPSPSGAG